MMNEGYNLIATMSASCGIYFCVECLLCTGYVMKKTDLNKQRKSPKILTDIIVMMIVTCIVGGMLVYAHYDIKREL